MQNIQATASRHTRAIALAVLAGITVVSAGCSVMRGQSTVGAYVDDKAIATAVKAKLVADKTVDAAAVNVDSLNGTVSLSGFAKSEAEKNQASYIARNTGNVRDPDGGATRCPACGQIVIARDGYHILAYRLDATGTCSACGHALAGRFGPFTGAFGPRRVPVHIHRHADP